MKRGGKLSRATRSFRSMIRSIGDFGSTYRIKSPILLGANGDVDVDRIYNFIAWRCNVDACQIPGEMNEILRLFLNQYGGDFYDHWQLKQINLQQTLCYVPCVSNL